MSYFAEHLPWTLYPRCPICEKRHEWHMPHDQGSRAWIDFCLEVYGRWPTWRDALRHCPKHIRADYCDQMIFDCLANNWPIPADLFDVDRPLADSR